MFSYPMVFDFNKLGPLVVRVRPQPSPQDTSQVKQALCLILLSACTSSTLSTLLEQIGHLGADANFMVEILVFITLDSLPLRSDYPGKPEWICSYKDAISDNSLHPSEEVQFRLPNGKPTTSPVVYRRFSPHCKYI